MELRCVFHMNSFPPSSPCLLLLCLCKCTLKVSGSAGQSVYLLCEAPHAPMPPPPTPYAAHPTPLTAGVRIGNLELFHAHVVFKGFFSFPSSEYHLQCVGVHTLHRVKVHHNPNLILNPNLYLSLYNRGVRRYVIPAGSSRLNSEVFVALWRNFTAPPFTIMG